MNRIFLMPAILAAAALLALSLVVQASGVRAGGGECGNIDSICTIVPKFSITGRGTALTNEQPDQLGRNVATILNLQLWRTLEAGRDGQSFGQGAVVWSDSTLESSSHLQAETFARNNCESPDGEQGGCNLILWGRVSPYGDSALVTASLTIPDYEQGPLWQVQVGDVWFAQDFPSRRYTFAPVVLTPGQLRNYSSPEHLLVDVDGDRYTIGSSFRALRHINSELTEVVFTAPEGESKIGIVTLDELGSRGNAVNFTAAVVRLLRKDWQGAANHWAPLSSGETPAEVKIDANWYLALALSKSGESATEQLRTARNAYPFSSTLAKGEIMAELAQIEDSADSNLESVAAAMNRYCSNFGSRDRWISETIRGASRIGISAAQLSVCHQ